MALGPPGGPVAGVHGLSVNYYDNDDLTGRPFSGVDRNINFNWRLGAPVGLTDADTFSARWTGKVTPRRSGTYTFYAQGDDGTRLWVDGRQLVDAWTPRPATEHSGTITLTAGRLYDIRMEFHERRGTATAKLLWSSPGMPMAPVPSGQLYADGVGDEVMVRSLSTTAGSYRAGAAVTVEAEVSASELTVVPQLMIAVRPMAGNASISFPRKQDVKLGPDRRRFRFTRTFRSPGTYVYWTAAYRDGAWVNLLPGRKLTIQRASVASGSTAPGSAGSAPEDNGDIPAPVGGRWNLSFHDEFEDGNVDGRRWSTRYPRAGSMCCSNPGNGEAQWYLPGNVVEQDGELRLVARRESTNGLGYSSGLVQSKPSFSFTYGYAEARMWLPKGSGLWPAFWTWPQSEHWPPEIDVVEFYGDNPSNVYLTYHAPGGADQSIVKRGDWTTGWHTFAIDWRPGSITWYIDGAPVKSRRTSDVANVPLYLIANLAVADGSGAPTPTSGTPLPASLRIDWIRVWKHA
jgi:beta-glucanase (GH16 family)